MVLLVEGSIEFEGGTPAFTGATIYVRLEKVSHLDAPAIIMAEYVKRDVAYDPQRRSALVFTISGSELDARERYTVRAHVDLDGDGKVGPGDYVSTRSYPVQASGYPQKMSILVKKVK